MAVEHSHSGWIDEIEKVFGAEQLIFRDLNELHGVKSVSQAQDGFTMRVVAYDDYPILSHIQTVCAWHQCSFTVESAGRVDGDIVVLFDVWD